MKQIRPGPYQTKCKEALMDGPNRLVWATHPQSPNYSMNARGRVIHIERLDDKFDYPSSYCGMRAVEYADALTGRRTCIQCVKIREQEASKKASETVVNG